MLDDSLANFEGQIQAGKVQVALLELLDDAQCVQIMVKAASLRAHQSIEPLFSGVPERGMADVVHQRERFGKFGVQMERRGNGAGNLRDFQGVRQAIAKVVGESRGENLSLRLQAPESTRMDHAIAVAGKVAAIGVSLLRMAAASGKAHIEGVGFERHSQDPANSNNFESQSNWEGKADPEKVAQGLPGKSASSWPA